MPQGPLSVLDLSIVTDLLKDLLTKAQEASSFSFTVTCAMPETVRNDGGCQLSLYLFHISQDKFQRNAPVMGQRAVEIPYQPLSLDLYYLLTAFSRDSYNQEQQAMSVALKCFHEHPFVRNELSVGTERVQGEFTLTMEMETADELGRLWQAISAPFRLSVVYKVSVVFMQPKVPQVELASGVETFNLSANPTSLPYASGGQVVGTFNTITYTAPESTAENPITRSYTLSPASVAPRQDLLLLGAGLNVGSPHQVYLLWPDGTEQEVTSWVIPAVGAAKDQPHARILLKLPATVGTPPADAPLPGVYQLRVGRGASGQPASFRSNTTLFSVAARVGDGIIRAEPPILAPVGDIFTITGAGFLAGKTQILLDTIPLTETDGTPGAGQFTVDGSGTAISFRLPTNLVPGRYAFRVRVNQIESAPAWWIHVS